MSSALETSLTISPMRQRLDAIIEGGYPAIRAAILEETREIINGNGRSQTIQQQTEQLILYFDTLDQQEYMARSCAMLRYLLEGADESYVADDSPLIYLLAEGKLNKGQSLIDLGS